MTSPNAPKPAVRLLHRIIAYSLAWILAFFATDPSLGLSSLVYLFPLGLFAFISPEHRQDGGWTVLIVGWAIYLIHACFYFRSRRMKSTLILLGLLALLLLCNVSGCRDMNHAH